MILGVKRYVYKLIRQGGTFKRILKELKVSQYYTKEEIEQYQNQNLQKMINHCYNNVPYYMELLKSLALKPEDIRTKKDLAKLPLLDKQTVKDNFDKLIAKNVNRLFCTTAETSGTTGTPAKFLRDYYLVNFENALLWRFWQNAGDKGAKRVILRGDLIIPITKNKPPFWTYYSKNELVMSSYHLNELNSRFYIKKLNEFKPEFIYAYPSSIYLLARFVSQANANIPLNAIFTSSETILPHQRSLIEEAFKCPIYDWYGQAERVSAIGQCEKGAYHIMEDASITEVIETQYGMEIVGTHLHNYIMPLIRYRTGDIVNLSDKKCDCGRHFPVVSNIQGRVVNYILTPEGNRFALTLLCYCFDDVSDIYETQFVQHNKNELMVNIVKGQGFVEGDKDKMINSIKNHISPNLKVVINEMKEIPRGPSGKFQLLVNSINDMVKEGGKTGEYTVSREQTDENVTTRDASQVQGGIEEAS